MVAHQHDGAPATGSGLRFQGHQEVEQRPHFRTAVHVVAGLNERDVAPVPATLAVDQSHVREEPEERVEISVDIADRDHVFRLRGGTAECSHTLTKRC